MMGRSSCVTMLLWTVALLSGCAEGSKVSAKSRISSAADDIHYDMSVGDLKDAIARTAQRLPLRHHWTLPHAGHEVMLTSAHLDPGNVFCFVFTDERLSAILPTDFRGTAPMEESLVSALAAEPMRMESFRETCRQSRERYELARRSEKFNIALAPMALFDRSDENIRKYLELMKEFDGTRARLGMTPAATDALFGTAVRRERSANRTTVTYGRMLDLDMAPVPLVSVSFVDDAAVGVETEFHVDGNYPQDLSRSKWPE